MADNDRAKADPSALTECARADYQERAFGELFYAHAKWIAVVIRRCNRGAFTEDIQFIRNIGQTTDLPQALALVASFQNANRGRRTVRTLLKFRVLGFKTSLLARSVFRTHREGSAPGAMQPLALRQPHNVRRVSARLSVSAGSIQCTSAPFCLRMASVRGKKLEHAALGKDQGR